jgi:DNA-binding MarR family transcriptional regulator
VAELHTAPALAGLSWPQFRLLGHLNERDYRASELADILEIGRPTLTTIGDGLVRRGLVERVRDLPGDRRGVMMRLTPAGRSLHALLKNRAVDSVERLLCGATDDERASLARGLGALERGLQEAPMISLAKTYGES